MILLDTDHLSVLGGPASEARDQLFGRLSMVDEEVAVPIIGVEELCRGRLAEVNRARRLRELVVAYGRFNQLVEFLADLTIAEFDDASAEIYDGLRASGLRVGTQDLRIAAIAIRNDATLLSANLRDFRLIGEVQVEDWLHPARPSSYES